jgi:hypothetical protein
MFSTWTLQAVKSDLRIYVQRRLQDIPEEDFSTELKQSAIQQLLQRAGRTFLWVSIIIRQLERLQYFSIDEVERTITNAPEELVDLFRKIVEKLLENEITAKILTWVVYAKRPLRLSELEAAIALDLKNSYKNKQDTTRSHVRLNAKIISRTAGTLLEVNDDHVVYLIHQSVSDFFRQQKPPAFCDGKSPNLYVAKICATYLSFENFLSGDINKYTSEYLLSEYPLLDYAANNWYDHIERLDDAIEMITYIERLLLQEPFGVRFWISFNRGTKYRYVSLVSELAICLDIRWLAELLLSGQSKDLVDDFPPNSVLMLAAGSEGLGVLGTLLQRQRDCNARITENIVKAAIGNSSNGKKVMRLLLSQDKKIQITEEVIKLAAGDCGNGKEMIDLLLSQDGEVQVTKDIVEAAAGNWLSGKEVMELLLGRGEVQITEGAVKEIIARFGENVVQLMLSRLEEVCITKEVVKVATGHGKNSKVVMLLLLGQGRKIQVTEEAVELIAATFDEEIMQLLLTRGGEIPINGEVVKVTAAKFGKEVMMRLLLKKSGRVQVVGKLVQTIATKYDEEVMQLLLARGEEIRITGETVRVIALNFNKGMMMRLLLKQKGQIRITEEVVEVITAKYDKEVMKLLLIRCGEIGIAGKAVKAIAAKYDREVMELLLKRGGGIQITEEVAKVVAGKFDEKVMQMLLLRGGDLRITEEVVKAAAGNWLSGREVMQLLLSHDEEIQMTEGIIKAAAGNWLSGKGVVQLILSRAKGIRITEEIIKLAVGNGGCGREVMQLLLIRDRRIRITEEVVKAAVGYSGDGTGLLRLLLSWDGGINTTGGAKGAGTDERGLIALHRAAESGHGAELLESGPYTSTTDVCGATAPRWGVQHWYDEVLRLLLRDGNFNAEERMEEKAWALGATKTIRRGRLRDYVWSRGGTRM